LPPRPPATRGSEILSNVSKVRSEISMIFARNAGVRRRHSRLRQSNPTGNYFLFTELSSCRENAES
jgi:hypothetical protein